MHLTKPTAAERALAWFHQQIAEEQRAYRRRTETIYRGEAGEEQAKPRPKNCANCGARINERPDERKKFCSRACYSSRAKAKKTSAKKAYQRLVLPAICPS